MQSVILLMNFPMFWPSQKEIYAQRFQLNRM